MNYTLMHKNVPVIELELAIPEGRLDAIGKLYNHAHLPIGTLEVYGQNKGFPRLARLGRWFEGRAIPASREHLQGVLGQLGLETPMALSLKSYCMSLSDHYWVRPIDSNLQWEKANFFENDFSPDVGELLFGNVLANTGELNLRSPDNTSDGVLRKKWVIENGKRLLIKGGSGDFRQEPVNEVISTWILDKLKIPHSPYALRYIDEQPYSVCETFATPSLELVPAHRVFDIMPKDNQDSLYTHLLRCADALGIPNVQKHIDQMILFDYIIANIDRHTGNFGFLRNPDTLKWVGVAPLFDNGLSLYSNTGRIGNITKCEPFRSTHSEQMKLVSNVNWYSPELLNGVDEVCVELLSTSKYISANRRKAISENIRERSLSVLGCCRVQFTVEELPKPKPAPTPKSRN